jgi:DNA repair exonuclease SbcCD nuclease subunit
VKILVTSDWHLDAVTSGVARFDEVARAVEHCIETAQQERVDYWFFLGDLCDPDAQRAPRCAAFAIQTAAKLAMEYGIPSLWLTGNHDVIEDGSGSSTLAPLAAAAAAIPLRVPMGSTGVLEAVRVFDRPIATRLAEGVTFIALPFVPRCAAYDPVKFIESVAERAPCPGLIVAGHLNVAGITPGSEADEFARGRDVWLPIDAIRERWPDAIVMNGHYHGRYVAQGDVLIPGSPARFTHGEAGNSPGCMIVEVP